ncbi:uncharacterized protein LOC115949640 [Quercus lobata]|uniref:uncharacterized protein LOC115949640 n=1 Tax=Quercus lobata TaxID=97700 RepID=UPI0012483729|nr:uncharacterized protein LOC115949640 [Quercus lobata]
MKTRDERVRLIQCLPDSNKGLNKDFLIVSGEWHDGVPCPVVEGEPDLNAFPQHFHLVNRADLETVLNTADFINEEDEGIPLVDLPPSPPASEGEGEFSSFEEGFRVFEQVNPSEDPSGDLGDPALSEAELSLVGTSSRTGMGLKRKPSTSLIELLEGQPRKGAQGTPQSNAPSPPPQPQTIQTKSSSTKSQPQSPRPKLPALTQPTLPPRPKGTDSKRKRSPKDKETMDGVKSQPSKEREEGPRAKQLKIGHQSKGKETESQSSQGKGKGIEAQSLPNA